jgi:thioesterase domain-containing protein
LASKGHAKLEIDDVFDLSRLPTQSLELKKALFNGFRDYIPVAYSGKLTLICAKTQPLLKGNSLDLGWSPYVSALDIRPIPGNHETILRPPHITELARELIDLMKDIS